MNYQWHYDKLIETRKTREKIKGNYYERHHIIPRSMGGSNDKENLVYLTAREHFIAHWLLWRIHRNRQTAHGFFSMISWNINRYKFSSRIYEEAKEAIIKIRKTEEYRKTIRGYRIPHEIRWKMTMNLEDAEKRIQEYRNKLSKRIKEYHDNRDKTISRYSEEGRKTLNKHKIGIPLSIEIRDKISIKSKVKGRKLLLKTCPFCKKEGKGGNMSRYHFDNCKNKEI